MCLKLRKYQNLPPKVPTQIPMDFGIISKETTTIALNASCISTCVCTC